MTNYKHEPIDETATATSRQWMLHLPPNANVVVVVWSGVVVAE
jgi:hypothetical protein